MEKKYLIFGILIVGMVKTMPRKRSCAICNKFKPDKDAKPFDGWCLFYQEERDKTEETCEAYTKWDYHHPRAGCEERKCAMCGKPFTVPRKTSKKKYCSMACKRRHYKIVLNEREGIPQKASRLVMEFMKARAKRKKAQAILEGKA